MCSLFVFFLKSTPATTLTVKRLLKQVLPLYRINKYRLANELEDSFRIIPNSHYFWLHAKKSRTVSHLSKILQNIAIHSIGWFEHRAMFPRLTCKMIERNLSLWKVNGRKNTQFLVLDQSNTCFWQFTRQHHLFPQQVRLCRFWPYRRQSTCMESLLRPV